MRDNLELIEWYDAVATSGWLEEVTDYEKTHPIVSLGWVIHEDDNCVILAATVSGESHNQRMSIPKGFITTRRTIQL